MGGFGRTGATAAADEDEVEAAVAVVIEETDAGTHGFDHKFAGGGAVFGGEADAGSGGDVFKGDGGRRGGQNKPGCEESAGAGEGAAQAESCGGWFPARAVTIFVCFGVESYGATTENVRVTAAVPTQDTCPASPSFREPPPE